MPTNEDYFKREEDRKWREKVDHEQVTLMTGHQVLDRKMDELSDQIDELDRVMRGDPQRETGGLIERLHEQETKINRLWSVIFMDAAGTRGLLEEWKTLKRKDDWRRDILKFWAPVVVAAISTAGLLLSQWPRVKSWWPADKADRLEQIIDKAKHPKPKHRRIRVQAPTVGPGDADDSAGQELP